jgi:uncharacterized protein (TIGR03067 family)
MRPLTILLFICLAIGCSTSRKMNAKANALNGTWIPIKQEMAGTSLPENAFQSQKLVVSDSTYSFTAESVDKGMIKYKDSKMDIYGKEGVNAGKHFTAIYKYENDQLTICYNLAGDSYPETFDTKGKRLYFLSVFKRN